MNIFYLHKDPKLAAQYLIDSHVSKMIIESAQMLANCYSKDQLAHKSCPRTQKDSIRRHSYFNHPCSVWVRQSISNFNWLVQHALGMDDERFYRTGKRHYTAKFINWCLNNKPNLPNIGYTSVPLVFGELSNLADNLNPVLSYQRFYVKSKKHDKNGKRMDYYTKREKPCFWSK